MPEAGAQSSTYQPVPVTSRRRSSDGPMADASSSTVSTRSARRPPPACCNSSGERRHRAGWNSGHGILTPTVPCLSRGVRPLDRIRDESGTLGGRDLIWLYTILNSAGNPQLQMRGDCVGTRRNMYQGKPFIGGKDDRVQNGTQNQNYNKTGPKTTMHGSNGGIRGSAGRLNELGSPHPHCDLKPCCRPRKRRPRPRCQMTFAPGRRRGFPTGFCRTSCPPRRSPRKSVPDLRPGLETIPHRESNRRGGSGTRWLCNTAASPPPRVARPFPQFASPRRRRFQRSTRTKGSQLLVIGRGAKTTEDERDV